jgi:hypothetical protein
LFLSTDDGSFIQGPSQPWLADKICEDLGSAFFDADGDGNLDLYVVSGGSEFEPGHSFYQDRLYKGDGKGGFVKMTGALPKETTSGSCVIPADFDRDGDVDLFVGGRLVPGSYPITPKSTLLRNDSQRGEIHFSEVTEEGHKALRTLGMVTDGVWADVNQDKWPDLIITGEWMQLRIFQNEEGNSFREITKQSGLDDTYGWWTDLLAADVDNDGDTDFLAGNAGLNIQLKATNEEPVELFAYDINDDGEVDPIICHYIQGKSYPLPTRDELLDQVAPLRKKFTRYATYADATIQDIVGEAALESMQTLKATTFKSSWLENDGKGKFTVKPLPDPAQVSSIQGFVYHDFDGDGSSEILAAGNFYPYRVQLGQSNASTGVMIKFENGEAKVYKPGVPLWLTGDIRDLGKIKLRNGSNRIVVSRNNDRASVYRLTERLPQ